LLKEGMMSRRRISWSLMLTVVLLTTATAVVQAESIYATAVSSLAPPIYLRLSEPASTALGAQVVNSGTLGSSLLMNWGIRQNSTAFYANSQPVSHVDGVRPDVIIAGRPCTGLESDNTAAQFIPYPTNASNCKALNVYDSTATGEKVAAMDQENMTYSMFFKTTDNDQNPRVITSHAENSNRFDLIMTYGKWCVATANYSATTPTNWLADSTVAFNDGNWHHLVAVRNGDDSANVDLYVDGNEITLTPTSAQPSYVTVPPTTGTQTGDPGPGFGLRIGSHGNKNRGWAGNLDEIAMWGRALSQTEAEGLFLAIPEPSSIALLVTMLLGGAAFSRRKS
jgi:hypothetical protein